MAKDIKELLARKLAENNQRHAAAQPAGDDRPSLRLPLAGISANPWQPRTDFDPDELAELAASIEELGLLQPVTVRQTGNGYQLIAGERRLRALQLLGRTTVDAILVPTDDADMAVLGLAENLQREDLSDYEIGQALRRIETAFPNKTRLAEALGLSREDMYRYYAFEALPAAIRARLDRQPGLLARSAAVDLKRVLQEHPGEHTEQALAEAWALLEAGKLPQTRLADHVLRQLAGPDTRAPVTKLMRGRKAVGSVSMGHKGVVVRLKPEVLTEAQERKLLEFLEKLVGK